MIKREIINNVTLLYQQREMPITSVAIACRVGSMAESKAIKGISHFTEHMIFKGTEKRTAADISSAIESVGGNLNGFTGFDVTAFHAKIPSKHFALAFDVLSDMVQNPRFAEAEIEKEKKVVLEEIKMVHDDPKKFIFEKTPQLLYKGDVGLPILGLKQSVKAFSRNKLLSWHKANYGLNNFIVSVVGKNDFEEVKEIVREKLLMKNLAERKKIKAEKICRSYVERRKHLEQAHLAFSFHLPNGFSDYRYGCEVIDAILGFGMSSWLFQEIREKRALAYSTHSYLELGKNYGYLTIYVGTDKNKVKEVDAIVMQLIKKLKSLDRSEIETAKEELIGNKQLRRENSLNACIEMIEYELVNRIDEYERYEEKISEVNLNTIKKALATAQGVAKLFVLPK
jgi:predicted Zn-dependent peptidase